MSDWTDEEKQKVIDDYKAAEPTPETSTEIVAEIAEEIGKTVNGVRAILIRGGVYVKKDATASSTTKAKTTRVNKAESIKKLNSIIEANGLDLDEEITGKLTGKAAVYFHDLFEEIIKEEE